jgi:hypothetical protein
VIKKPRERGGHSPRWAAEPKKIIIIYHGAFTVVLRTLFWCLCNIAMFELLAVPQRGIPYVYMGFRIVLYISNLFCIDNSDFLPRIQYICWNFSPICFLLANVCLPRFIVAGNIRLSLLCSTHYFCIFNRNVAQQYTGNALLLFHCDCGLVEEPQRCVMRASSFLSYVNVDR